MLGRRGETANNVETPVRSTCYVHFGRSAYLLHGVTNELENDGAPGSATELEKKDDRARRKGRDAKPGLLRREIERRTIS
jgi:hypothetical protein